MKKTLTLTLLLFVSVFTFAQVEWELKSIKSPTEMVSTSAGTSFDLILECQNNSETAIPAGDTVFYNMILIDISSNRLLLEFPANAGSGNGRLRVLDVEVPAGGTYDISVPGLSSTLLTRNSINVRMGATTLLWNRTNPQADTDSTNNSTFRDMIWFNETRNGVSVNELTNTSNLRVFPNPANSVLNVDVNSISVEGATIELVDLSGKTVINTKVEDIFKQGAFQLNVSDVENGLYIVRVKSGDQVSTSRVTVSH